ncbi:MAG: GNAT family N-acetyltransferase [Chloroflexota bacterium]
MVSLVNGDAASVAARVIPFLLEREAENNVMIGFISGAGPLENVYLRAVEVDGRLTVAAFHSGLRLLLSQASMLEGIDGLVTDVSEALPDLPGFGGPQAVCERFRELWEERTGTSVNPWMRQCLMVLHEVTPPSWPPGDLRVAAHDDLDLLAPWVAGFIRDTGIPDDVGRAVAGLDQAVADQRIHLWERAGGPVSMARITGRTPHGARVSGVYTPPELRGHGYASACVAALSQRLLDSDMAYCCLYTDLANPTSNHIYQAIGYEPVFDVPQYLCR